MLTAAHCAADDTSGTNAYIGSATRPVAVTQTVRHPSWNGADLDDDVALLRLAKPSSVTPVKLASPASDLVAGASVRLLGWGEESSGGTTGTARAGDGAVDEITHKLVGIEAAPSGGCPGDSGGPVLDPATGVQIGVIAGGPDPCGTYTFAPRASSVRAYLESFLEINHPPVASGGELFAGVGEDVVIPLDWSDPDGDVLEVTSFDFGGMAFVETSADPPTITFRGVAGETGTRTFEYTLTDGMADVDVLWTVRFGDPVITVADLNVPEPAHGRRTVKVPIELSAPSPEPVTFTVVPVQAGATLGADVRAEAATLTIAPGTTTATYSVVVLSDRVDEYDETLELSVTVQSGNATPPDTPARFTVVGNLVPVNHPPVARGGEVTTTVDTPAEISIDFSDPDGDAVAIVDGTAENVESTDCPSGLPGLCTVYIPAGFIGDARLSYTVEDEHGLQATATWIIHVVEA